MLSTRARRQTTPMGMPPYEDGDFGLVQLQEAHARALFTIVDRDRTYLGQFQNWPNQIRTEHDMRSLIRRSRSKSRNQQGYDMAILHHGKPVGKVGLVYVNWYESRAEIGYWLAQDHQGHGLITRATRVVTAHALGPIGLERVQIRCAIGNTRSRAVPERLGFAYDGVMPQRIYIQGKMTEDTRYTMTRAMWYGRMIYHITTRKAWEEASAKGHYSAPTLETDGFIHAARYDQVTRVADAVFHGRSDLVLLCIDPERVRSELRYEAPDGGVPMAYATGETFPHIDGPLNTDAVFHVVDLQPGEDGTFTLPDALAS